MVRCVELLVVLQVLFAVATSHDMCDCRYLFVEQPANSVMCNPYPASNFITRCIVEFSTTEGGPLSLDWYSRNHFSSTPRLLISGFVSSNGDNSVESTLTIPLTPDTADEHEGYRYFCRVKLSNGTIFQDSQEVYLFPEYVVTNVLDYPDCEAGSIQSTLFEECIDPNFQRDTTTTAAAEPTTPPSTDPPPPPTTTAAETTTPPVPTTMTTTSEPTTPPPTTPSPTTSPPTTPPPTTAPPTTIPPPTTSPPTAPPPEPTQAETTANPTTESDSPSGGGNPLSSDDELLLYAAIAAAIVLIVIVFFLVLCLCVWNRVCRQSKYCTCCSPY